MANLLAVAGGMLDAYTFFCRGGVFANAQTGNIVMLGISIATVEPDFDIKYVVSILVFVCGILSVRIVEEILKRKRILFVRRAVLLAEMAAITAAGAMPQSRSGNLLAILLGEQSVWCVNLVLGSAFLVITYIKRNGR